MKTTNSLTWILALRSCRPRITNHFFSHAGLSGWLVGLLLSVAPAFAQNADFGGSGFGQPLEIVGSARPGEGGLASFSVLLFDRQVRNDTRGYSPVPGSTPIRWSEPAKVEWDFGDASPRVSTGERVSVSHRFEDQGTYTVSVQVSDSGGVYASGEKTVQVGNDDPKVLRVAAAAGDRPGRLRFTASAQDTPADTLTYRWDFGDGESREGIDLWTLDHDYSASGDFTVELLVSDEDGGTRTDELKVRVSGAEGENNTSWQPLDSGAQIEAVISGLKGSTSGSISAQLDSVVRSMAGVHLSKISSGVCRFTFTTWDDPLLAHGLFILDFPVIPPGGASYRLSKPQVSLVFKKEAEHYLLEKRWLAGASGAGGLGGIAESVLDSVGDEAVRDAARQRFEDESGIDARARVSQPEGAMPAHSPFGLDEGVGFATRGGEAQVTFIPGHSLRGRFDLTLGSGDEDWSPIQFKADFAIDLSAARRDGLLNYDGCDEPPLLEIEKRYPEDKSEHFILERPPVRVRFDASVVPESVTERTFQVGYHDPQGTFVAEQGRILRAAKTFWFVPDEPLAGGVRYTARVLGGDDGVHGVSDSRLAETEQGPWHEWTFTTMIDFATEADGEQLLACHVYQTARDVPLIEGKPAFARLYASWPKREQILATEQVQEFDARVVLELGEEELASKWHHFVRPDLWSAKGLAIDAGEHTAILGGFDVPAGLSQGFLAKLEVRTEPGGEIKTRYRSRCPAKTWDKKPKLSVDVFALRVGEWESDEGFEAISPILARLSRESELYAWQLFPVADVKFSPIRSINRGWLELLPSFAEGQGLIPPIGQSCEGDNVICGATCWLNGNGNRWAGLKGELAAQSSADFVLLLGPHEVFCGGFTSTDLGSGQSIVAGMVSGNAEHFNRYVNGVVHEMGHGLLLPHLPYVATDADRKPIVDSRESGAALWYGGIEGLRMSRDGTSGVNKSSVEGNPEHDWLTALMFPGTIDTNGAFIANHHYREIQRFFEQRSN